MILNDNLKAIEMMGNLTNLLMALECNDGDYIGEMIAILKTDINELEEMFNYNKEEGLYDFSEDDDELDGEEEW